MDDPYETLPVLMTRAEAERFTRTLAERQRGLVREITTSDPLRAMHIADLRQQLDTLIDLYACISTTFQINGA